MAKAHDSFRLGITVIVIFVLFIAVVLWIGSGWERGRKVEFVARFPHTLNLPLLEEGVEVIGFGQVIGRVTELGRAEDLHPLQPGGEPTLFLEVRGVVDASAGLRRDCRMVAEGPVLGGRGHLRVTHRGRSSDPLDPSQPIYGGAGGFAAALELIANEIDAGNPESLIAAVKLQLNPEDAASLIWKVHRSMDDLNALTGVVATQMNPQKKGALIAKIGAILDNLNLATGHLRAQLTPGAEDVLIGKVQRALDSVNQGLADAVAMLEENRPRVSNTLASIEHASATVDTRIADSIADELDTANSQSLLSRVHRSFGRVEQSLEDLTVITDKTRGVIVLNEVRINRLLANVKEASVHMKAAAEDLRRKPWRLLYRPEPGESREADILDAARAFSEAAGRLDDSASQLQALLAGQGDGVAVDDPELAALRAELLESFERFQTAERTLWDQLGGS
ncbi:MAG: hypothetical protein GY842_17485 [bacterium]|nr:hypothetical protein [bacterium]